MCVKFPPEDLNLDPYPPHPTSTYTCGVTNTPRVCGGKMRNNYSSFKGCISYFLVDVIISKLNIFPNKQTFHIHLIIIKIKNYKK